jgi:two-component system nitrate/nitrite response regulator NarL
VPIRILIADDHSLIRSVLKTTLENHANWQVCGAAKNGLEAVEKAAELKPDIIILDFAMPGMHGLQAAREILLDSPGVPILLYTNYIFPYLSLEAARAGVRGVVDKGLSGHALVSAVESLLDDKPQSAAASA